MNPQAIKHTLAASRVATYEQATIDLEQALALYQWNANVSGAFLSCLQMCEVSIRNAISEILVKIHGTRWAWEQGFIGTLPNPQFGYNPRNNLNTARQNTHDINNVIPELRFVFWQNMFTSRHDNQLWLPYLKQTFPNIDQSQSIKLLRAEIYKDLDSIRKLRNRIAHHEPIFKRDLTDDYHKIIKLIGYRCQHTADWVQHNQQVIPVIAAKPK